MATKQQQNEFLSRIVPLCQRQAAAHGYKLFASVTIAQAIHESGWGTSKKMVAANALFGVKVGSGKKYGKAWHGLAYKTGTTEYYDGKTATKITDYFRQYNSVEDSICDYMDLICNNSRYKGALARRTPEESIAGIVAGGYATGPNYVAAIKNLIKTYNLTKYDIKDIVSNVCPYTIPMDSNKQTLKRGSHGDTVKALQWCLNELIDAKLVIDGAFGPATELAVRKFQAKAGLEEDGIAGKQTWNKIRSML